MSGCKWISIASWISSWSPASVKESVEVTATAVAVETAIRLWAR